MRKFAFDLKSADGKKRVLGLFSALLGLLLTLAGNHIFFLKMETAYKTFPVLLLGFLLSGIAIKLGSKKLGIITLVLSLPAAAISLFIIVFFATGGSR